MKRVLSILTIAAIITVAFTACKNNTAGVQTVNPSDTSGLAEFKAWKSMNEMNEFAQYQAWKADQQMAATAPVVTYAKAPAKRTVRSQSTSGTMSSSSTNYAKTTTKKKGWSKAAKYAVIGGGGGAVLGAVVNKRNRVAGGVFGGILGGGLGYVLGRAQDKKDGRY